MRVVDDTNILISAIIFRGLPDLILKLATARVFTLVTSPVLLDELDRKLRGKFHFTPEEAQRIRRELEEAALVVVPQIKLSVVRDDPDDDRVLECAVTSNSQCLVTGDRHLLKLQSYEAIGILTARQFMDNLGLLSITALASAAPN